MLCYRQLCVGQRSVKLLVVSKTPRSLTLKTWPVNESSSFETKVGGVSVQMRKFVLVQGEVPTDMIRNSSYPDTLSGMSEDADNHF